MEWVSITFRRTSTIITKVDNYSFSFLIFLKIQIVYSVLCPNSRRNLFEFQAKVFAVFKQKIVCVKYTHLLHPQKRRRKKLNSPAWISPNRYRTTRTHRQLLLFQWSPSKFFNWQQLAVCVCSSHFIIVLLSSLCVSDTDTCSHHRIFFCTISFYANFVEKWSRREYPLTPNW